MKSVSNKRGPVPRWTEQELEILKEHYATEGLRIVRRLPGRSASSISSKARVLGLRVKKVSHCSWTGWSADELNTLSMWYPVVGMKVEAMLPQRSLPAIYGQATRLGLTRVNATTR